MRVRGSYLLLCWEMRNWISLFKGRRGVVGVVVWEMLSGVLDVYPLFEEGLMLGPFIGMPAFKPGEEVKLLREAARWADDI
jgi:hypothetical protein